MALDTAFSDLSLRLERLHDALVGLRLAVVEDRPLAGAGALLDRLGEVALDLEERVRESVSRIQQGWRAVQYPRDVAAARQVLTSSHAELLQVVQQLSSEIASFGRIAELAALERERGGEWVSWVRSARSAVDQCQEAAQEVHEALFECWKEISERAGLPEQRIAS